MGVFLKLDGIEGDAKAAKHDKWILCDSFSGGGSRPMYASTPGKGQNREASTSAFQEISLRMKMNAASPKVFMASVMGDARKATVHITRAGDKSGEKNFLEVDLENAYVSRYSVDMEGDTPWESIALNFTKMTLKYLPNKGKGEGTPETVGFDMCTGKKT
jgi:type VI secretion system secreted protein Hcp